MQVIDQRVVSKASTQVEPTGEVCCPSTPADIQAGMVLVEHTGHATVPRVKGMHTGERGWGACLAPRQGTEAHEVV